MRFIENVFAAVFIKNCFIKNALTEKYSNAVAQRLPIKIPFWKISKSLDQNTYDESLYIKSLNVHALSLKKIPSSQCSFEFCNIFQIL